MSNEYVTVCPGCFEDAPLTGSKTLRLLRVQVSEVAMTFAEAEVWAADQRGRLMTMREACLLVAQGTTLTTNGRPFWLQDAWISDMVCNGGLPTKVKDPIIWRCAAVTIKQGDRT